MPFPGIQEKACCFTSCYRLLSLRKTLEVRIYLFATLIFVNIITKIEKLINIFNNFVSACIEMAKDPRGL